MNYKEAKKRAKALVAKMTVEEKASQLLYTSPAIERLGIKEYNWWNESSHGVARAGTATVFPHAIALGATFDPELIREVGDVISTEGRAKYNQHVKYGDRDIFKGLTFWAPNINIFRDPRWGRGQETFGEDPFLTATLGENFVKGVQGDGEFLKASACSKHFAAHSGPEAKRHCFDAKVSEHDMRETYLPAFEKTVKAGVSGVMGAYNRTNGEPCCASPRLMNILYGEWGFKGYFTSDCWALSDFYKETGHQIVEDRVHAAAMALKAGCDLNCGSVYEKLMDAYEEDLITEDDITRAAENVYTIRFMLGEFEKERPYSDIPYEKLDCREHRALNLKAAEEAVVLLKNENGFLPLDKNFGGKIAVVGPNAVSIMALEGNYNGRASEYITVADGVRRVFENAEVRVEEGSKLTQRRINAVSGFFNQLSDGVAAASYADVTVLVLGLDRSIEGEETGVSDEYTECGDRKRVGLPQTQLDLAEKVCDACENVIVVIMAGGTIDPGEKVRAHAKAIINAWYPGALGGLAIARILAGETSPSGRLPLTVYGEKYDLPDFEDYSMQGRTYRYIDGAALYPFGFGLSYAKFAYENAKINEITDSKIKVSVTVKNESAISAVEKAQVYAKFTDSRTYTPHFQLCAVKSVALDGGKSRTLTFDVDRYWTSAVLEDGTRVVPDGEITLYVGGHQPDEVSDTLTGYKCAKLCVKSK